MNGIKIGNYLGRSVYVSEEKLNTIAKMYPTCYLGMLEGASAILHHPIENKANGENEAIIENTFGKVGIKRENPNAKWFVEWCGFNRLESF